MQPRSAILASVVLLFTLVSASSAHAQRSEQDRVWAWFTQEWDSWSEFNQLQDYELSFRIEFPSLYTREELRALQDEIRGKVDHPLRWDVEESARRLEHGPSVSAVSIVHDGTSWRVNQTSRTNAQAGWHDFGYTPEAMWVLTESQMAVLKPGGYVPPGRNYADQIGQLRRDVYGFLCGRMNTSSFRVNKPVSIKWVGGKGKNLWDILTKSEFGFSRMFQLRWDAELGRGFVQRVTIMSPDEDEKEWADDYVGSGSSYQDWQQDAGFWHAGVIEEFDTGGRIEKRLVFEGLKKLKAGEFKELVSVPEKGEVDLARGKLAFTSVLDYRGRDPEAVYETPNGVVRKKLNPGLEDQKYLRPYGWLAIGIIVSVIVAGRIRRARLS